MLCGGGAGDRGVFSFCSYTRAGHGAEWGAEAANKWRQAHAALDGLDGLDSMRTMTTGLSRASRMA